jgi:hypothetical protein
MATAFYTGCIRLRYKVIVVRVVLDKENKFRI